MDPNVMGRFARGATTRREMLWGTGALGAAIASGSLLAACGGDESKSASGTIEFWDEVWGGETYQPTVRKLIAEYEKANPDVKIKYRVVPWANFFEVYNTAIASGSTPDVCVAPTYPWEGSLASSAPAVDRLKKDGVYEDLIPAAVSDQKDSTGLLTGLPWSIDTRVITYRKDLFEEAGIPVPTTLDELGDAARELSGDGRYGLGFTGDTLGSQMLYSLFLNNGGGLFGTDCGPSLLSDRNAEVCDWIQGLMRDGAIPKAAAGLTSDDGRLTALMNDGGIAMSFNVSGWYQQFEGAAAEAADIMPPPEGFHGDKGSIIYYLPVWTFKRAEGNEAAADFVAWYLTNLSTLFEEGQVDGLPARKSFYDDIPNYSDPRMKTVLDEWVPVGQPLGAGCQAEMLYQLSKVEGGGFLETLTQDILTGKPVDESLQTAQDQLAEIVDTA